MKKEDIINEIYILYRKGYSYSDISSYFNNNFNLEKKFSKRLVQYYIERYILVNVPINELELISLYYIVDYSSLLTDCYFKAENPLKQLVTFKSIFKKVKATKRLMPRNKYYENLIKYVTVMNKLKDNDYFKVYNKENKTDYLSRNLMAVKIRYFNQVMIFTKDELFNWMKENDYYLIFSKNRSVTIRGIKKSGHLFINILNDYDINLIKKYIFMPEYGENTTQKLQVCSEDFFLMSCLKHGKEIRYPIRVHGNIKIPKLKLVEKQLYEKIKIKLGVKPLCYSDIDAFLQILISN